MSPRCTEFVPRLSLTFEQAQLEQGAAPAHSYAGCLRIPGKFFDSNQETEHVRMVTALSNEGKIQNKLALLGCSPSAFCKLAGVCGKTRFMEAMNGLPGRHFSDDEAEALLSCLEQLWELQSVVDQASRDEFGTTTHVPIDFTQYDKIKTALATRLAQKICLEDNDHALDAAADRAVGELRRGTQSGVR